MLLSLTGVFGMLALVKLQTIFEPIRQKTIGRWRKSYNQELQKFCSQLNVIVMFKK
jgi:hypothetical protein